MALATQADVQTRATVTFTLNPDPFIADLLVDAQAMIESRLGRAAESASYTETYDPGYPTVFLRHWPVTDVAAVTVDGTALVVADDVVWYPDGRINRASDGLVTSWGTWKRQSVVVEYTGGYLSPDHDRYLNHLGSLVAEMVGRAFRQAIDWAATPEGAGAIQSIALEGSDTVTYATGGGDVGSVPVEAVGRFLALLDSERRELDSYRGLVVA